MFYPKGDKKGIQVDELTFQSLHTSLAENSTAHQAAVPAATEEAQSTEEAPERTEEL